MRNLIGIALASFLLSWMTPESQPQAEAVDLCDLIRDPGKFDDRLVRLRASYRYGFEWQELFCISCRGLARVWLNLGDEPQRELARELRQLPKHQGTINGTFTGVFRGKPAAYGDGGYQYQLDLSALTDVEIVSKSGAVPEALSAAESKRLWRYKASPASDR